MKIKDIKEIKNILIYLFTFFFLFFTDSFCFSENKKDFIELFNKEFFEQNKKCNYFISIDFLEALAKQDKESIYEKYPYLIGSYDGVNDIDYYWYDLPSTFEGLLINFNKNDFISLGTPDYSFATLYYKNLIKEKTKTSFNIYFFEGEQGQIVQFDLYSNEGKEYTYDVDLIFDGDYVDFYLYGKFVHRFCKLNEKTYKQLFSLFQENKVDLTKVTWPKHADGSCDYNTKDLLTNIKLSSIMFNQIDIPIYENPEINSSVICNLKKDSKVLIQRIGKIEKIDELEDNWVQVEIQQESTGVTDEDYVIGKFGWCYGGYLKENKSVDNIDLKKKEEKINNPDLIIEEDFDTQTSISSSKLPIIISICILVILTIVIITVILYKKKK